MKSGIIYKGRSLLDGTPIVVIGLYSDRNTKTGLVLQTYVLVEDMPPLEASKTGRDYAICGDCQFRGEVNDDPKRKQAKNRRCYVNLGQGPTIVYKSYKRGVYTSCDPTALGRGRFVRVGTYGDPGAVPQHVWDDLLLEAEGWTAYSHQSGWRPDIAMQSADDYAQAKAHWSEGRRTFRVVQNILGVDYSNETLCPASKEAGRRVTCNDCKLCAGWKQAKSIAIVEH